MIGQSFAPLFDPQGQKPAGGPQGGPSGPPQAIQTINTRLPRVLGAGAPAPAALLNSPGSAGLPMENISPIIQAILQSVLGHFSPQQMSAPSAPGGFGGVTPLPMPGAPPQIPGGGKPKVEYEPLPGGTAGPNPRRDDRDEVYPRFPGKRQGPDHFVSPLD